MGLKENDKNKAIETESIIFMLTYHHIQMQSHDNDRVHAPLIRKRYPYH